MPGIREVRPHATCCRVVDLQAKCYRVDVRQRESGLETRRKQTRTAWTPASTGGNVSQADTSKVGSGDDCRVLSLTHDNLNRPGAMSECLGVLTELGNDAESEAVDAVLLLDMSDIERITSEGLNELIGFNSEARSQGVSVQLLDVCTTVRDVFKVTRLERMFEFGTIESGV